MLSIMLIMITTARESRKKLITYLSFALWTSGLAGCAYRLTNLHTASPNNIKTIHVEAVYDTSLEAIPHEQLWDELQRAIATNGQIRLVPAKTADALLRAHIIRTQTVKAGERKTLTTNRRTREADIFAGQQAPPSPGQLRDISTADDYYVKTGWTSIVQIELWDLTTRKLLLQRDYPMSGEVLANRGDVPAQIHHLRHEESFAASFKTAARGVAEKVVTDLLVR